MTVIIKKSKHRKEYLCIDQAVDRINNYWEKHPEFIGYDSSIGLKDKVDNAVCKAKTLGLNRVKKETWEKLNDWLRQEYNSKTSLNDLIEKYKEDKNLNGIGNAILSKTLHKIPAKKMPIIDSIVANYYGCKNEKKNISRLKKEIENSITENPDLEIISKKCSEKGIAITPLRAWDILVWSTIKNKGA